jgi:ribosomal protein S18 acetylase RimI-like enzyme
MKTDIREMTVADYDEVFRLWTETEGISLGDDDTQDRIALYLARNQGLCFVATADGTVVGTVLCGHDGRRGILRHLAVDRRFRRQGIARALIDKCLTALASQGIRKCNIFALDENATGLRFWEHMGWYGLEDNYRTLQTVTNKSR